MPIFALVDCNNFYVSCERVFNPALENKPVIVLSNNDGCCVARSNEAKLLNIKMGEPYFQILERLRHVPIVALSSNYTLYADLSSRVMRLIYEACPEMECYSIDEAFLRLDAYEKIGLQQFAIQLKKTIKQSIGIPISIGIATTKVLSKIANHIAKKHTINGVFLLEPDCTNDWLAQLAVDEIWGIGRQLGKRLQKIGIYTAKDLKNSDPQVMQRKFSVVMSRIVYELRGVNCLDLEAVQPKKSIVCSKSFGQLISDKALIAEALSNYCARACEKLREQNQYANRFLVFLRTNPHNNKHPQRHVSLQCNLPYATADTCLITQLAKQCLDKLYRPNFRYQKVGIMLLDFTTIQQQRIFEQSLAKSDQLMSVMDNINRKFGSHTLFPAACGIHTNNQWHMKRTMMSPKYTTSFREVVRAR